jgi:hypothetical protein
MRRGRYSLHRSFAFQVAGMRIVAGIPMRYETAHRVNSSRACEHANHTAAATTTSATGAHSSLQAQQPKPTWSTAAGRIERPQAPEASSTTLLEAVFTHQCSQNSTTLQRCPFAITRVQLLSCLRRLVQNHSSLRKACCSLRASRHSTILLRRQQQCTMSIRFAYQ